MSRGATPRVTKSVCVIGAGPSGITAAKNFKDQQCDVTVYDYGTSVGGNWRFDDVSGHSSVFETTHLISSRYTSEYDDYPLPPGTPDYPSHAQLLAYFKGYADHFGVTPLVQFRTLVKACVQEQDGRWRVTSERDGIEHIATFDALVVCNGHHWKPRWPEYPGTFTGEYLHSHTFKRAAPFAGKRVLVIGGGNSACDIAVETSRVAASTDISWRRGYFLAPKFMFGQPSDRFYFQLNFIPISIRTKATQFLLTLMQGRNSSIGLQDPDHKFGQTHPTVNSELYYMVRHGRVKPRVDIARFEGSIVHFTDGSSAEYDVVIAATGYWIDHPFFDRSVIDFTAGQVPLYLRFLPATVRNLYFIGLFQPLGCIWPGAELQSKLAARHLRGTWRAPSNLAKRIETQMARPEYNQLRTPRHTITVDDINFRKRLRAELKRSTTAESSH